jgi:tripartite-type tricarboxylate transporter receptor subunit TctC
MNLTRRQLQIAAVACAAAFVANGAAAQTFPSKPVKIIVGAPPGGTADMMARVLGEGLAKDFGQPVVVENKAGGAGMVALQELIKAPHDGYTILLAISGFVTEVPHAFKLPLDPMKAVVPLAELARTGLFFVGTNGVPASNLKEVIAHVKANPGKISYASYTAGTVSHTLGLTLNQRAGLDMTHVGYRGSAPGLSDVMAGHVSYMFDAPATVLPLYKAGMIKVFATTAPERNPAAPEIPTFAELGFKEMTEMPWVAMFSTPDVPAAIQVRLREALVKLLAQPAIRDRWTSIGMSVPPAPAPTQQELIKTLQDENARHGKKLAEIGFKPE